MQGDPLILSQIVGSRASSPRNRGVKALEIVAPPATTRCPSCRSSATLLETFVVRELVRQSSWLEGIAALGHWRTYDVIATDQ